MIATIIRSIAILVMLAGLGFSVAVEAASDTRGPLVSLKASEARGATVADSGIALPRFWSGRYFYGKNNRQSVPFELDLKHEGTTISGRITEPRTFGNPTSNELYATIFGSVEWDGSVRFTKTYDGTAGVSHSVEYVGLLKGSGDWREITGTWRIKRTTGPFTMRSR